MNKLLLAATCAALLAAGGAARAAVLDFDDPGVIEIDNDTGIATYTEDGYTISGMAASFLPLDGGIVGGFDSTAAFTLKQAGGGAFSLLGLDRAFYDLGTSAGTISIAGYTGGVQVVGLTLGLGTLRSDTFGSIFVGVDKVTFSGTSGFMLDNISAVPEPGTAALMALGLGALGLAGARRRPLRGDA